MKLRNTVSGKRTRFSQNVSTEHSIHEEILVGERKNEGQILKTKASKWILSITEVTVFIQD
jgi:hypothetical protein